MTSSVCFTHARQGLSTGLLRGRRTVRLARRAGLWLALSVVLPCLLLLGLLLGLPQALYAQDGDVPVITRTVALTNATVVRAPGDVVEGATVVVRNGLIEAVGRGVDVPFDAERIAADSLTVYAGFIDGLSHVGVETPEMDMSVDVDNPDDPPPGRAGIQPDRSVRPMLTPDHSSVKGLREMGFTTAHVVPEGQMLPGTGAIVQLAGADGNAMLLQDAPATFFQHEGARSSWPNVVAPSTPMAVLSTMRDLVRETERRQAMARAYADDPQGRMRPPSDPVHDALVPVVEGSRPLAVYTEDVVDIHRSLALRTELGVPMMLTGLSGAFEATTALQSAAEDGVPLFLTLALPEPPDDAPSDEEGEEEASEEGEEDASGEAAPDSPVVDEEGTFFQSDRRTRSFEDTEAEATALRARRDAVQAQYEQTAATLREAGLAFGFMTKDVKAGDVRENLRTMIEQGLSEEDALAALTTTAAAQLGLSDRLGTVEEGKIANLVVTDGNYFAEDTAVRYVFVDGHRFEMDVAEDTGEVTGAVAAVAGEWEYEIDSPQGTLTGTIQMEESGGGLSGTISSPTSEEDEDLRNVSFDGSTLSFDFDGGQVGTVSVSVDVDGEAFDGNVSAGQAGSFPITGTRTSTPEHRQGAR